MFSSNCTYKFNNFITFPHFYYPIYLSTSSSTCKHTIITTSFFSQTFVIYNFIHHTIFIINFLQLRWVYRIVSGENNRIHSIIPQQLGTSYYVLMIKMCFLKIFLHNIFYSFYTFTGVIKHNIHPFLQVIVSFRKFTHYTHNNRDI